MCGRFDPRQGISHRECEPLPDVEVAGAVKLLLDIAVVVAGNLEGVSPIVGSHVERMGVSVTGGEGQPVRIPLGRSGLQAVVVGVVTTTNLGDVIQVWKPGIIWPSGLDRR